MNAKIRVIARTGYLLEADELMGVGPTREQIDRDRERFRRDFSKSDEQPLEI